jgi:hypothetical protein
MNPRFDWGNPETLGALLRHVTGHQYRYLMFTDGASMQLQLRYLAWHLPSSLAWVGLLLAGLGLVVLLRRATALGLIAAGAMLAGGTFAIGYRIPDLDAYLLAVVFGLGLGLVAGLFRTFERFGARVATAVAAALVLVNGAAHWPECDERRHRLAEQFARDVIGPLPPNAVIITDMWELIESPTYYLQGVERVRPDVVIVSSMLTRAGWYLDELERRAPDLVARCRTGFDDYRATLRSLEQGVWPPGAHPESERKALLETFAASWATDRPVFATGALPRRPGWSRVPWHLLLWLRPDSAYVPEPPWEYAFTPWRSRIDVYAARTCQAYAEARVERARYEAAHGRRERAESLVRAAARYDPHVRPERVGPMPLGVERAVLLAARFFRELESPRALAAVLGPAAEAPETAATPHARSRDRTSNAQARALRTREGAGLRSATWDVTEE